MLKNVVSNFPGYHSFLKHHTDRSQKASEPQVAQFCLNQNRKANIEDRKKQRRLPNKFQKKTIYVRIGSLRFLNSFVCKTCLDVSSLSVWNAIFCVTCCLSNGCCGEIQFHPLCSPTLFLREDNTNEKKNPSHGNEAECKQESRWDLSLKHKGNEADVYLLGCCCYLETSGCVRDCFIMKSRKQLGSHFNAALHRHIFCGYA